MLLTLAVFGFSQIFTLIGEIINEQQGPISFVSITLFETDSEAFLKGTNKDGNGVLNYYLFPIAATP